jgi:hypothetical protein
MVTCHRSQLGAQARLAGTANADVMRSGLSHVVRASSPCAGRSPAPNTKQMGPLEVIVTVVCWGPDG